MAFSLYSVVSAASLSVTINQGKYFMDAGQNSTLNVSVTGGNGNYTCLWSYYGYNTPSNVHQFANQSCSVLFYGNSSDLASPDIIDVAVNDSLGDTGSSQTALAVKPAMLFSIKSSATQVYVGGSISISNTTSLGEPPYSYYYLFPSGAVETGNGFSFTNPGTYNITEVVEDSDQAQAQESVYITVLPLGQPVFVNITAPYSILVLGNNENVLALVHGGVPPYSYIWFINGAQTTSGPSNVLNFNPTAVGSYKIYAKVSDQDNDTNQSSNLTISVVSPLSTSLHAHPSLISADQTVLLTNQTQGGVSPYTYYYALNNTTGVIQNGNNMTFSTPGNYSVTLNVKDSSGQNSSSTVHITVTPELTVSLTANRTLISSDQSVSFTNVTSGGTGSNIYSYSINNSAGVTQSGNKFTFSNAGNYLISFTVTDESGELSAANVLIKVTPQLTASLSSNETSISAEQSIRLYNTTSGGTGGNIYSYSINNTAGVSESGNKFTFNNAGKYSITLTVTDLSGEIATSTVTISVTSPLGVSLAANRTFISADQSVLFTNTTSGGSGNNVYSYSINNSAGVTQSGNKFAFGNPGNYLVTIKAIDLSGDVATSAVAITATPVLATSLSANKTLISADQAILLANSTTGGTGSNVYSYSINNSAGISQLGNRFTFSSAGKYLITLKVSDLSGEVATATSTITVTPALVTSLNANRTFISADQSVLLKNTTSGGTSGNIYSYSTSNSIEVSQSGNKFAFSAPGNYLITLKVTDLSGEVATSSVAITVTPVLDTSLTANMVLISAGQSILFVNTTSGGTGSNAYSYQLNKTGQVTKNGNQFSCKKVYTDSQNATTGITEEGNEFTFSTPGNYLVTLYVTDQSGEAATSNVIISVTQQLTTSLTANKTQIYAGQSVKFSNLTSGGTGSNVYAYILNKTAGVSESGNLFTFSDTGNYLVTLDVSDISGETASSTVLISVQPAPLPSCSDKNNGNPVTITGSGIKETVYITDQSAVDITGSSDNVTIEMPGSNCDIAVDVTGSSNKVNVYNGTITLTVTGSSDVTGMHNTIISSQTVTGSSDRINNAILNGTSFTITGSSNLIETVDIESLKTLTITGSSANVTMDMLTTNEVSTTITGSSNIIHIVDGTIALSVTGSSNYIYYHDTSIASEKITGSNDKLIED